MGYLYPLSVTFIFTQALSITSIKVRQHRPCWI